MSEEATLKQDLFVIARSIEQILRSQAPSKQLAGAVQVTYEPDGFLIALDDSAKYGIYLWRGTGKERDPGATDDIQTTYEAIWNKRPNNNPGKGVGGIKPRYWLNLKAADILSMQEEITRAIEKAVQAQADKIQEKIG